MSSPRWGAAPTLIAVRTVGCGHLSLPWELEKLTPASLTTSRQLTTGVDVPTCKNIAIIGSEKRLKLRAQDLVEHFETRLAAMVGKAMTVCSILGAEFLTTLCRKCLRPVRFCAINPL
jgi:hypothetical protein